VDAGVGAVAVAFMWCCSMGYGPLYGKSSNPGVKKLAARREILAF
jgi:hypothetical protein